MASSAPSLTLTYFPGRGRAETTRLILKYGGVDFTDERIVGTEWGPRKAAGFSPSGGLPVLTVDGKALGESLALELYAAKLAGLVPADDLIAAQATSALTFIHSFIDAGVPVLFEKDEDEKKKKLDELKETTYPEFIRRLTAVHTNTGSNEFLVASTVSFADIAIFNLFGVIAALGLEIEADAPFRAITAKVAEIPSIKAWVESRPETPF